MMALHSWPLQQAIYSQLNGNIKKASAYSDTTTYAVTVANGTNAYGSGNKYYISTYSGASPTISLIRGGTYRFTQEDNGGGSEFTTGVTKSGTAGNAGAYTEITLRVDSPTLYYYCQYHSGMGGTANITGELRSNVPIYDDVPEGSTAPYVVIGEETAIDIGTKDKDANEHTLTLHIWSEYRGRYEIKTLMQEVYSKLHNNVISVAGASLVNLRCEFETTLQEADGITRHGVMRFRAVVFDN